MDFMKLLRSLEEALYEVMVWLVFYPLTFWRVITRPAEMMAYADDELDDEEADRYSDKLSPPIFLAITLGISHLIEKGLDVAGKMSGILADEENLLAFRLISFSVYPIVLSVRLLRRQGIALDRKSLRPPFYAQCYAAAPWALLVGLAPQLAFKANGATVSTLLIAIGIMLAGLLWYMILQARWFARNLGTGVMTGLWNAFVTFVEATVIVIVITTVADRV